MSLSTGHLDFDGHSQGQLPEQWARDLERCVHIFNGSPEDYLAKFVPARTPEPAPPSESNTSFPKWKLQAGDAAAAYPDLIASLSELVSGFPKHKQLTFLDCHSARFSFPFTTCATPHRSCPPDIAVSLPGERISASHPNWKAVSMIVHARATHYDDPFLKHTPAHRAALAQLALAARDLMHAHGLLACFVLGIYGDAARLVRFDHAGAVASQRFQLSLTSALPSRSESNFGSAPFLRRFFWQFVHPCAGGPVVGCDPTVRRLDSADAAWLRARLERIGLCEGVVWEEVRWCEVHDDAQDGLAERKEEGDGRGGVTRRVGVSMYFMVRAIDVSGRLFSRATSVWLGIRDTRRRGIDGTLDEEDSPTEDDLVPRVIKDAWRALDRRPEKDFYDRLESVLCGEKERTGLARLLGGGDLGEQEVCRWETALYGARSTRGRVDHEWRLVLPSYDDGTSSKDGDLPQSLCATTSTMRKPMHRPLQQTFTWRLCAGESHWEGDRSHVRFVVDKVGRDIRRFRCTKELVTAIRDAVKGHRAAHRAGILHRDVSPGNIMIVHEPHLEGVYGGFLHDFDCATMTEMLPNHGGKTALGGERTARGLEVKSVGMKAVVKGRAGTYPFMAIDILGELDIPHQETHDIESFYWVLLCLVFEYTRCRMIPSTFTKTTDWKNELFKTHDHHYNASGMKMVWLTKGTRRHSEFEDGSPLLIEGNAPLTDLLHRLYIYIAGARWAIPIAPLDHDEFIGILDDALERNDWPRNDYSSWMEDEFEDWGEDAVVEEGDQCMAGMKRSWLMARSGEREGREDGSEEEVENLLLEDLEDGKVEQRRKRRKTIT